MISLLRIAKPAPSDLEEPIDTLIRGARVIDGTGNPWSYADIGLEGDRIAALAAPGSIAAEGAKEVVDAAGTIACPGFIDIQSHSIIPLMIDGCCLSKITQGVTTEIMGEARTPAPFGGKLEDPLPHTAMEDLLDDWRERARGWTRFGDWLEAMVEAGVSPNVGSFLGGGTLRAYARGNSEGAASPEQMELMRRVMEQSMVDGAFGVSYALIYAPDAFASTEEIIEICKTVAKRPGIYITHIRSEGEKLVEALEEAVQIGREAEIPVEIYHLKAAGKRNWGKLVEAISTVEQARASGIDITADMYSYTGAGTGLASVLPPWVAARADRYQSLRDPSIRERVRAEVANPSGDWEAMGTETGPEYIMPIGFEQPENKEYVGKRLSEIADARGQDWIDAVLDLLASEGQRVFTIYFSMTEENLKRQLQLPWIKISTDAGGVDPSWAARYGPLHPRSYGTYPRVLGKYVREEGLMTLEDAIRKMTSSVAARLGISHRGQLRPGFYADVVIFDPETITDRATFSDSHQLSLGVRDMWVNGIRVIQKGSHTGAKPGRIVRPG